MIQVAAVNHSTKFVDMPSLIRALNIQVARDFYPAWGINAYVTYYAWAAPPATSWVLGFFDNADQAGALGYHDVTPKGLPLGKVFVKTSLDDGALVSVVASHELLEMLADPWINVWIMDASNSSKFWIREVGDPVESDGDGYKLNGLQMSNFVLPSYFQPDLNIGPPYDFRKQLTSPLPALRPGGYLSYAENGQVGQIFGSEHRGVAGKIGGSERINKALKRLTGRLQVSTFQTS